MKETKEKQTGLTAAQMQAIHNEVQEEISKALTNVQHGFTAEPEDFFPFTIQEAEELIARVKAETMAKVYTQLQRVPASQFYRGINTHLWEDFMTGDMYPVYQVKYKVQGHPSNIFFRDGQKLFSFTVGENPRSGDNFLKSVTIFLPENQMQTTLLSFDGSIYKTFPPATIGAI